MCTPITGPRPPLPAVQDITHELPAAPALLPTPSSIGGDRLAALEALMLEMRHQDKQTARLSGAEHLRVFEAAVQKQVKAMRQQASTTFWTGVLSGGIQIAGGAATLGSGLVKPGGLTKVLEGAALGAKGLSTGVEGVGGSASILAGQRAISADARKITAQTLVQQAQSDQQAIREDVRILLQQISRFHQSEIEGQRAAIRA